MNNRLLLIPAVMLLLLSACGGGSSPDRSVDSPLLGIGNEGGSSPEPPPAPTAPTDAGGMVSFSGGTFTMGWNSGSGAPEHSVTLSGFRIDKTEVRQSAYESVMGSNPSEFRGGNLPVESVSWSEARDYCSRVGKRLPTEAEWEYAARNGGTAPVNAYATGSTTTPTCSTANFDNGGYCVGQTSDVGSYAPSSSGLYDMAGNVWEWVSDWYSRSYYANGQVNPQGPGSGTDRVVRGGAWNYGTDFDVLRASGRGYTTPTTRDSYLGFRCASN